MAQDTKFFLSAIDNLKDPSRSTRWRFLLPSDIIKSCVGDFTNTHSGDLFAAGDESTNNFALHVKTCAIPEITSTQSFHNYMGFKSGFVTSAKIDANFAFDAILLEDMRAYEYILAWHQACLNTGVFARDATGVADRFAPKSGVKLGLGHHKDSDTYKAVRNNKIKVEMYNWFTGEPILIVTLINAVPTSVGGWSMDYADQGKLNQFKFTLHADRWTVFVAPGGGDAYNTIATDAKTE